MWTPSAYWKASSGEYAGGAWPFGTVRPCAESVDTGGVLALDVGIGRKSMSSRLGVGGLCGWGDSGTGGSTWIWMWRFARAGDRPVGVCEPAEPADDVAESDPDDVELLSARSGTSSNVGAPRTAVRWKDASVGER